MVLTNNRLQCHLHNPPLIEVIPIQRLNPHPVAKATAIERGEDMAVEKVVAMVGEMARAGEEEFNLRTTVRIIAPTPSHT